MITVESVVEAYKKHDLNPIEEIYFSHDYQDEILCCGLTALAIDKSGDPECFLEQLTDHPLNEDQESIIFDALFKIYPGLNHYQIKSFMAGWDGRDVNPSKTDSHFNELGRMAWHAVNEELAK